MYSTDKTRSEHTDILHRLYEYGDYLHICLDCIYSYSDTHKGRKQAERQMELQGCIMEIADDVPRYYINQLVLERLACVLCA